MTVYLTDEPASVRGFVPEGISWQPMTGRVDALISRLGPARSWWTCEVPTPGKARTDRTILVVDEAPASQFQAFLDALKAGESLPDGLVALALTGRGFRGQRERGWTALRGNLHLTAHYKLAIPACSCQASLTMIPAIAAVESIVEVSGGRVIPRIKWVNDVVLGAGKAAGVLTATSLSGALVEYVTFGIGMNIDLAPVLVATPFVPEAACLADAQPDLRGSLPRLVDAVVRTLDEAVELLFGGDGTELFQRYCAYAGFIGTDVMIWPEGTEDWQTVSPLYEGRVLKLNPDLSLVVEGLDRPITSGRLALKKSCRHR